MKTISTQEELEQGIKRSHEGTVVIFKHSTRCPISSSANEEMKRVVDVFEPKGISFGLIYVVENRDISLALADQLGIKHESPQVLVLKGGQVVWHESHYAIRYDTLEQVLTTSP
ncbi:bacillithiol system redox-active protein YtxJ [Paenibacillus agilis]|uniref:Bacillithiol system redox-active protein YtxJ n=1 Tax=Paenibacillus agilis TaxID=3020863 RepID=A0A559J2T6_9BACL|nr:bacillithiol system redox-active protein YtxJ [Paenibacillus agilis]TVX94190.1 bacillithiol system redox-active protein YtxJ [Paenibacillus agilis]